VSGLPASGVHSHKGILAPNQGIRRIISSSSAQQQFGHVPQQARPQKQGCALPFNF